MTGAVDHYREISYLNDRLLNAGIDYEEVVANAIGSCPSNMDSADFVYGLTVGIMSAILDTNDKIADFLDAIHQVASGVDTDNPLIKAFGNLLHHSGDWMDKIPTNKVNKSGKKVKGYVNRVTQMADGMENTWDAINKPSSSGPHRIFWGHDIFSCHEDNPFAILIKQYGVGRGILQAIRHLTADTCSTQGLPLPFSSYFDYIDVGDDGSKQVKNRLLDFCQDYSSEVLGRKQGGFDNEIFNHMFSLRMQDILTSGFVAASITVYSKGRKIDDQIRLSQIRVIGYMGTAYGSAIIGAATHGGVVYISWPAFSALAKNVAQMIRFSQDEVEKAILETERLIQERERLEAREKALRGEVTRDLLTSLAEDDSHSGRTLLLKYLEEEF